jgi:hypothetical protein
VKKTCQIEKKRAKERFRAEAGLSQEQMQFALPLLRFCRCNSVHDRSSGGLDFGHKEVGGDDLFPMTLQKLSPSHFSYAMLVQ